MRKLPQLKASYGVGLSLALFFLFVTCSVAEAVTLRIASAELGYDMKTKAPVITVRLTAGAKEKFSRFTAENVGRKIEFRLEGKVVSKPILRSAMTGGSFQLLPQDEAKAKAMVNQLRKPGAKIEVEIAN